MALTLTDAARKPKPAPSRTDPNTVGAESQATNLMAPANPPTERAGGRRLKKRGGKRTRQQEQAKGSLPAAAATQTTPATVLEAARTAAPTAAAPKDQSAHIAIDRAIDTLKEVLIALRAGRDPVQCVLEGMKSLLCNV